MTHGTSNPTGDTLRRMGEIRDGLRAMLSRPAPGEAADITELWRRILDVQDYVFDLSPPHLARIRLHTNYFTRFSPSTFQRVIRDGREAESAGPVKQYRFFTDGVPEALWFGEPPLPGSELPSGFPWRGRAINPEVVRYQACLTNLHESGVLDRLRSRRPLVVVEIGGGFGGQALALMQALPDLPMTYILIDIPNLLLFPGCYVLANRPHEQVRLFRSKEDVASLDVHRRQLVLWPLRLNEFIPDLPPVDLVITMASLQEMTPSQIERYAALLADRCTGYLYSDNIECHPDNHELAGRGVTGCLEPHWQMFPPRPVLDAVRDLSQPWCHRTRIGTSRQHDAPPPRGSIRMIGGNNKKGRHYRCELPSGGLTAVAPSEMA